MFLALGLFLYKSSLTISFYFLTIGMSLAIFGDSLGILPFFPPEMFIE